MEYVPIPDCHKLIAITVVEIDGVILVTSLLFMIVFTVIGVPLNKFVEKYSIVYLRFSVCAFENNIYITGGHSNIGATVDAVSIYMSNINQWSLLSSMIHPRERHGSAALDGCVYVAGIKLSFIDHVRLHQLVFLPFKYRYHSLRGRWVAGFSKKPTKTWCFGTSRKIPTFF